MLWFNFIYGLNFFKPVWFSFPFVSDYDNERKTMKNKNKTGLKNFKPNIKLNNNIYINLHFKSNMSKIFQDVVM